MPEKYIQIIEKNYIDKILNKRNKRKQQYNLVYLQSNCFRLDFNQFKNKLNQYKYITIPYIPNLTENKRNTTKISAKNDFQL